MAASLSLIAAFSASSPSPGNHVIVRDQESGKVFFESTLPDSSTFELSWIHSIELVPWREKYLIDDGQILLTDVYLKSYGAGAPTDIGTTKIEGNTIHTFDIDQEIPRLNWVHSHATEHTLTIDGTSLSREIPHRTFMELVID